MFATFKPCGLGPLHQRGVAGDSQGDTHPLSREFFFFYGNGRGTMPLQRRTPRPARRGSLCRGGLDHWIKAGAREVWVTLWYLERGRSPKEGE